MDSNELEQQIKDLTDKYDRLWKCYKLSLKHNAELEELYYTQSAKTTALKTFLNTKENNND